MPRRTTLALVTGAALLVGLASVSPASANWTTNGNATGTTVVLLGEGDLLTVHAGGASAQGLTCSGSTSDSLVMGSSSSGNGLIRALDILGKIVDLGCKVQGLFGSKRRCGGSPTGNAISYNPSTSVTTMSVTGIHCTIVKTNGSCGNATTFNSTGSTTGAGITVSGSVPATYGNTSQALAVGTSGQNLNVSWSSTGCMQGTGTGTAIATLTNSSGTSLTFEFPPGTEVAQITN